MPGQTNSWMATMQGSGSPCIADTMNMHGASDDMYGDGAVDANGEPIEQYVFSWWWLVAAVGVGYLLKGRH